MRGRVYHQEIVRRLESRLLRDEHAANRAFGWGAVKPGEEPRVTRKMKVGIWVWIVLLGADVTYELFAFADGPVGEPTLSQIIKGLVRSGGRAGMLACIFGLFGAAIVLSFHWGLQWF